MLYCVSYVVQYEDFPFSTSTVNPMSLLRFAVVVLVAFAGCSRSDSVYVMPEVQFELITIKGRVTDIDGQPIAGAIVFGQNQHCDDNGCVPTAAARTDESGEYILETWMEDQSIGIGVWKGGMMATLKNLHAVNKVDLPIVDFTMKPAGKPIMVKILDKQGNPVKGGFIVVSRWGDRRHVIGLFNETSDRGRTDENGLWTWNEAPDEEVVFDMFFSATHMSLRQQSVVARDEEYVFIAVPVLKISGDVTDSETGQKIPQFDVYFGRTQSDGKIHWNIERGASADGTYSVSTNEGLVHGPCAVRIEARGYTPAISRDIAYDEESITIDVALQKSSP